MQLKNFKYIQSQIFLQTKFYIKIKKKLHKKKLALYEIAQIVVFFDEIHKLQKRNSTIKIKNNKKVKIKVSYFKIKHLCHFFCD